MISMWATLAIAAIAFVAGAGAMHMYRVRQLAGTSKKNLAEQEVPQPQLFAPHGQVSRGV